MKDSLVDIMPTVCTLDPAIDQVASKVEEFAETRDLRKLVIRPGATPIVFHLRPIGIHLMSTWVDAHASVAEKWRRAFQVSIEKIENYPADYGLKTYLPTFPMRLPKQELIIIGDDEIDELAERIGGHAWVYEIGHVAYERAHLGKALSGGAVTWSLPLSSRAVLDRMKHLRAAQNLRDALTTFSDSSQRSSAPSGAPTSAPPSDVAAATSAGTSDQAASPPSP